MKIPDLPRLGRFKAGLSKFLKDPPSSRLAGLRRAGNPPEKFSEENPPPLQELTQILAEGLVKAANHRAFELYRNRNFRKLISFEKLEKIEQDRIFNELVLSGQVLIMLILEAPDLRVDPEFKDYLRVLKDEIPEAHLRELKALGVERKYVRLWRKLIAMRYEEYVQDQPEVRKAAYELEALEGRALEREKVLEVQALLPLHTIAMGGFRHITRGKGKPEDPLFKMILHFCEQLFMDIRFSLEGYQRPLWRKLWVKAKISFSRFFEPKR